MNPNLQKLLSKKEQSEFVRLLAAQSQAEPKTAVAARATFSLREFVRGYARVQKDWQWDPTAWKAAARAKRPPMDEETKAYLKELGIRRKTLRPTQPKAPVDPLITLSPKGGESKLQKDSDRAKLVSWLATCTGKCAALSNIDAHFGKSMKGVIGKLAEKGWVK